MTPFIEAAIVANEEIAKQLSHGIETKFYEKTTIGAGGDISSQLDLFAESIFVKHLQMFGTIESEESGIIGFGKDQIILDPIDGSANALSGVPYYGTSIAKVNEHGLLDAAIVCNLVSKEIFIKEPKKPLMKGYLFEKAFKEVTVTQHSEVGLFEKSYAYPLVVNALHKEKLKFRAPGAIALSLAYAHQVSYVLFIGEFRIYDFAAGLALCEGLEVIVEADYVIVSKEKEVAHRIEQLILETQEKI
jgi:myo-inositol-1(or 4)-monophosphatase